MKSSDDRSLITVSYQVYGVLLAAYPRRFQEGFRTDMALVFRDGCREAYRKRGTLGLVPVWGRALLDLGKNALAERVDSRLDEPDHAMAASHSCSGCYSEVEPDWRTCRICGTVLNDGSTHVTRTPATAERGFYPMELGRAAARPLTGGERAEMKRNAISSHDLRRGGPE